MIKMEKSYQMINILANTPATDEEYKKWVKSKPKAKAEEELDRFEKWISKPSYNDERNFGFICNSNYCSRPLTAGLLVVWIGLGNVWLFKIKELTS
nr:hypothetical protein [Mycoplasmopsis bovis]